MVPVKSNPLESIAIFFLVSGMHVHATLECQYPFPNNPPGLYHLVHIINAPIWLDYTRTSINIPFLYISHSTIKQMVSHKTD